MFKFMISALFLFTLITGFSAPVLRAAIMLSLLSVGKFYFNYSSGNNLNILADEGKQNKPKISLEICSKAIECATKISYKKGLAKANLIAGVSSRSLSDFEASLSYYSKALELYKELDDRTGRSRTLNSIANIHYSLSDYKKALDYYKQTRTALEGLNDKPFEATVFANIALTYQAQENIGEAFEFNLASLKIYKELNLPVPHALLNNVGIIYQEIGDFSTSLKYFCQALALEEQTGNLADQSYTLGNMGVSFSQLDDNVNAVVYLSEAIIILKKTGNVQAMSTIHKYLGNAYKKLQSYSLAIPYYYKSLKYSREINDKSAAANILNEFGELYFNLKDYFNESLKISIEINDEIHQVKNYTCLAKLYILFNDMDRVTTFLNKAIELAKIRKAYKELSGLYKLYSSALKRNGDYKNSAELQDEYNDYEKKSLYIEKAELLKKFAKKEYFEAHANGNGNDMNLSFLNDSFYTREKAFDFVR